MDKAVVGYMRIGYFRIGVFDDDWDTLVQTCENLSSLSGSQAWNKLKKAVTSMGLTLNVTKRALTLGSADAITGWYAKSFTESTIEMILVQKGSTSSFLPPGTYVRTDALGLTADTVEEGDEILANSKYYEVKTVRPHYLGDSFYYRECDLTLLPLENLTGATYTESTVEDARYRNKVYLETWLSSTALPNYIVAYGEPDYPMVRVFHEKGVDLVYSLGEHTSDTVIDSDHYPFGYKEHVPITTLCINKINIAGTKLMHQAETELRRVAETYPLGSLRALGARRPQTKRLGSLTLYSAEYMMEYQRDKT
jgi:hypothetical protein